MMDLLESLQEYARNLPAELKEKNGMLTFSFVVAGSKTFLSKQKLIYEAKLRINQSSKVVKFTEMLKESSAGMQAGAGFQMQTYSTVKGGQREGGIEHQSNQFGKKYSYQVDFKTVHNHIEDLAKQAGYKFHYQLTSLGL